MSDPEDALRDLANASSGDPIPGLTPDTVPKPKRPAQPTPTEPDPAEQSASALAQLSGSTTAPYDPGQASVSRRRHRPDRPDVGMMQFQLAAIPILITVALLMSALGIWGILVRNGNTSLPMADQPHADKLATLTLVGFPLALCLIAGAGFLLYQYLKDKKKLAAYEEMMEQTGRG